ncbi:hypothetical protein [Mycolicibacterium neoaurum]|nr:hypothetical protein [Mycolicibacterium neoaurum]
MGLLIAVIAIAGLAWQHHSSQVDPAGQPEPSAVEQGEINHDGHDHGDGHAVGEYQPDPSALPAPPDFSPEAARVTVERFAANFASPNGNREDWLARLGPDVMPELLDQYRLTDIRNVPQTTVAQVDGPLSSDPIIPTFQVNYSDGTSVEISVGMDISGWKVSTVVPVSSSVPAPAPEGGGPALPSSVGASTPESDADPIGS